MKRLVIFICMIFVMTFPLKANAMEQSDTLNIVDSSVLPEEDGTETMVTDDISDMVFRTGGWGVPQENIGVLYAIGNRDQLEADILDALHNEEEWINVSKYNLNVSDKDAVSKLIAEILNTHAELFYVNPGYIGYSYSSGKLQYIFFDCYYYTEEQKSAIVKKVKKVAGLVNNSMSDEEKALVLHDYLVQNCAYAYQEYLDNTIYKSDGNYFDVYGALINGRAVCQGYSEAYRLLLMEVGIEADICSSQDMNHAWNRVLIDGKWYHVDATWDDPTWNREGRVRHEYFLLSDTEMGNRKHYGWEENICTSTKYDAQDYWWRSVESQIVFKDGKQYYIESNGIGFSLIEKNGSDITIKYENDSIWKVWGSSGWWIGGFATLTTQNGYIYFNDTVNLYVMKVTDSTPKIMYTYDKGDGYIYGAMVYEDGYARLSVDQTPNRSNDSYVTVDLRTKAPKVDIDYMAGTISTTTKMEYSLDKGNTWTSCSKNMKIKDFAWNRKEPLSIQVRTKASGGEFASEAIEVKPIVFKDVESGAYYEVPVDWAIANGITNGKGSEITFCPADKCTRGQVVTFLWRANGCPEPTIKENSFTDISESDYFYKAVLWAVENGITNGYGSDTIFKPEQECTRGQVATFMWRTAGEPSVSSVNNKFTDLEKGAYYYSAVQWAVMQGITNGYGSDTIFNPEGTCSRGEIVTFLYRGKK